MQLADLNVMNLPSDTLTILLLLGVIFFLFFDLIKRKLF